MATIVENIQTLQSIKTDIKDAIISKGVSVGNDFRTYAQAITDLPSGGGGGTEIEDAIVQGTIGEYYNDRVSIVGDYLFTERSALTSVNFPNCTSIGSFAFSGCSALTSINFPNCTSIYNGAFMYCSALTSINFPNCTYVGYSAFSRCSALTSINFPNCTSIFYRAFANCSSLSLIIIPLCMSISDYAFSGCANLKQVYLNSVTGVTHINLNTFLNCPKLTSVYVPSSLVNAFKVAPYWSSILRNIVPYTEG